MKGWLGPNLANGGGQPPHFGLRAGFGMVRVLGGGSAIPKE
jgi:hypothetical protein